MPQTLDLHMQRWRAPNDDKPRALWIEEALAGDDALSPPLEAARRHQVCIVGGGFTGLWTAIRLREQDPALSIAILEADFCGAGASGRNSGAIGTWWSKLAALIRLVGKDDALTLLNASVAAVHDVETFVAGHHIDCALRRSAAVWSATAPAQIGAWEAAFKAAELLGLQPPWRRLDQAQLRALYGTRGPVLAGVVDDRALRAQPARLARGLRAQAVKMGVEIFERSPVTRITGHADRLQVHTPQGSIACERLVLAANAWMAHLPEFHPHIAVVSSDIVATDPIPALLAERGMLERPHAVNSRLMLNYGGITPDGRVYLGRGGGSIAFGGRIDRRFDYSARQAAEVQADFRYLYPELDDVPITRAWAGPIDRATTGLPWFGSLEACSSVCYGIGYSGHGVGATALGGRILASLVLGKRDDWTAVGRCLQRARRGSFPPEPVRFVGGHVVRAAVARKELAEREGRRPTRLDKALAGLAPATITDAKPVSDAALTPPAAGS